MATNWTERIKTAKARLLWKLILETPGTEDLESPLRRLAPYEKLSPAHKDTLSRLVTAFEEKGHAIEEEARKRQAAEAESASQAQINEGQAPTIVTPDEIIPPAKGETETT